MATRGSAAREAEDNGSGNKDAIAMMANLMQNMEVNRQNDEKNREKIRQEEREERKEREKRDEQRNAKQEQMLAMLLAQRDVTQHVESEVQGNGTNRNVATISEEPDTGQLKGKELRMAQQEMIAGVSSIIQDITEWEHFRNNTFLLELQQAILERDTRPTILELQQWINIRTMNESKPPRDIDRIIRSGLKAIKFKDEGQNEQFKAVITTKVNANQPEDKNLGTRAMCNLNNYIEKQRGAWRYKWQEYFNSLELRIGNGQYDNFRVQYTKYAQLLHSHNMSNSLVQEQLVNDIFNYRIKNIDTLTLGTWEANIKESCKQEGVELTLEELFERISSRVTKSDIPSNNTASAYTAASNGSNSTGTNQRGTANGVKYSKKPLSCFRCGEEGHFLKECPKKYE
jgi:hypothetical protein